MIVMMMLEDEEAMTKFRGKKEERDLSSPSLLVIIPVQNTPSFLLLLSF
jgi:thioredoxin-related protein